MGRALKRGRVAEETQDLLVHCSSCPVLSAPVFWWLPKQHSTTAIDGCFARQSRQCTALALESERFFSSATWCGGLGQLPTACTPFPSNKARSIDNHRTLGINGQMPQGGVASARTRVFLTHGAWGDLGHPPTAGLSKTFLWRNMKF